MTGQQLDGAALLNRVRAHLARYICTVTGADLDLLTLWSVHTHLVMESYTSPRLLIDSPVPGSGKTTALDHLHRLCLAPVQMAALSSPALLTRMLDTGMRTLLIDEADRSLTPDKEGIADLLAVLNSGYKRGATRPVLVATKGGDWTVREMPTYAPVAMAGNNPNLPEDTRSRTIRVLLLPDLHGLVEESDWELIDDATAALADAIREWVDQVREQVRTARPQLPEGITGRFREKWAPLRRVAELAGGRWPEAVDVMAVHDKEQAAMDAEDGLIRERPHVLLLRHLGEVWPDGERFTPTTHLVAELAARYPASWGPDGPYGKALTAQRMGRMLATSYKVNSTRETNFGPRGYTRASLADVWSRMRLGPNETGSSGLNGSTGSTEPAPKPVQPVQPVKPVYLVGDTPNRLDNPDGQEPLPIVPSATSVTTVTPSHPRSDGRNGVTQVTRMPEGKEPGPEPSGSSSPLDKVPCPLCDRQTTRRHLDEHGSCNTCHTASYRPAPKAERTA